MEDGFSFAQLEPDGRFQTVRRELGVTTFGLNAITLQPGQCGRVHRHKHQEEVYLVLEGQLSLYVENEEHALGPGALARVAPGLKRQLVNRRPQPVTLIALGGAVEHVGRDGEAFASWDADEPAHSPQDLPLPEDFPVEPA